MLKIDQILLLAEVAVHSDGSIQFVEELRPPLSSVTESESVVFELKSKSEGVLLWKVEAKNNR